MPQNYNDLIGPKSRAGSIQNFVRHARAPVEVILEEAQALIYSLLRVREMRASAIVSLGVGAFTAALPTGFLEAIVMRDREGWEIIPDKYVSEMELLALRCHDEDALTTLSGNITASATSLSVADDDDFPQTAPFSILIDSEVLQVTAGAATTTWTVTRGFAGTTAAVHASGTTVDGQLESGTPMRVAVFDEMFQFDCKADETRRLDLVFYKSQALLSATNTTNFLTRRYPHLVRVACLARAAAWIKDAEEKEVNQKELYDLIMVVNAESDQGKAT